MMSLLVLPQEIVVAILSDCNYTDILFFSRTCRAYHKLVAQSSLLQLQVELQANGFQLSEIGLGRGNELATRALLEEFRRFRDGWLYLKIGEPLQIEPANSDMRLYELRQGYYAAAISKAWNVPGHVKLLSLHDKSSSQTINPGVQFREFQLDPSQDLMVLVSIAGPISIASTVYLFSILEARPHPTALHPDWSVNLPFFMDYRTSGIFVEIMDDLLAIKYISYEGGVSNVLIWNWKTGCLLNRIEIEGLSCTFGFLTADSLILFQSTEVSSLHLLVYSNIRTSLHPTSEHIPNCNSSDWPAIAPSFDFGFPSLPVSSFAYLLMRSEPVPTLHSTGPAKFLPTPEARVIQLSLTVIQDIGRERELSHYQIFLSKERLLRLIENPPEYTSPLGYSPVPSWFSHMSTSLFPPSDTIHIPWEAWGERATRWFDSASAIRPWICRAFGTRFIRTYPCETHESDLARPYEYLSILEFHPSTVRRFSSLGCDKHLSMWQSKEARRHYDLSCTDEETEYVLNALHRGGEEDEVFVDTIDEDVPSRVSFNGGTVVSRLPYRVVTKRKPVLKHSGWMMDNNVIVGMPPWRRDDLENVQSEYMNIFTPLA